MRITIDITKVSNGAVIGVLIGDIHWATAVVQSTSDYMITSQIENMITRAYEETVNANTKTATAVEDDAACITEAPALA